MSIPSLATSTLALPASEGGHEVLWHLPLPAWSYGAIALAAFLLLLVVAWVFRNAGHTLMTAPEYVEHAHGTVPGASMHGTAGHGASAGGAGGHGSAH